MVVSDIIVRDVVKVKESDRIRDVLERFLLYRICELPVVNDRNEIVGWISDREIMKRIGRTSPVIVPVMVCSVLFPYEVWFDDEEIDRKLYRLMDCNVMEVATRKAPVIRFDSELDDAAALLGRMDACSLLVEKNGVLAGRISPGDILRCVAAGRKAANNR